jgi:hypothetical protein
MPAHRTLIAALLAATVLAACGSSKKGATSTTTSTATTLGATKIDPSFIARVDAICASAAASSKPFPYPNFNPGRPDVKTLPKVGAFFARQQAVADALPKQLRQLGSPTTGQAIWSRMLALATQDRVIADRQIKAAKASDVAGFVATLQPVTTVSQQLQALARQAGFPSSSPCGKVF